MSIVYLLGNKKYSKMKVFIGLALLSVAFATPVVQPITLPKAPLPAMESGLELPPPEMPEVVNVPAFQIPDISPAFVPQEVMEALKNAEIPADIPVDPVQVVDVALPFDDAKIPTDASPVNVVYEAPLAEEVSPVVDVEGFKVKFVEEAFNNDAEVAENVDTEVAENFVAEVADEQSPVEDDGMMVKIVNVAFNEVADEETPAEDDGLGLNIVEVAENIDADVAKNFVAEVADEESPFDADGLMVNFVDEAFNAAEPVADHVIVAPHFDILPVEEIVADHVHVIDAPIVVDLEKIVAQVFSAQANGDVRFEDGPVRPAYIQWENPMWR